jgi:hypothetical protein
MKFVHVHCALAFAVALTSLAGAARADVTPAVAYNTKDCRPARYDEVDRWQKNDAEQSIKNNSTERSVLFCPIKKLASGPGVYDDYIKTVSLPFTFAQAGQVECVVQTWRTGILYGESSVDNVLTPTFGASLNQTTPTTNDAKKTLTITGGPATLAGYWDGNSAGLGRGSWYYSMVRCSVPPGAKLWPYKITEAGTNRGYTIDPMISCPLTSDMHWRVSDNYDDSNVHGPSGFVMAQAFGTLQKFYFTCPVKNGQVVQLGLGHASGGNISGCSLDSTNMAAPQWPASVFGPEWPSDVIALPYTRSLYVPSTGAHTLTCGQTGRLGDSKWMSIRTAPFANRIGKWAVTASNNAGAANQAIDANGGSRWTTNGRGLKNMWYQVDLGTGTTSITNLILDAGTSTNDYARKFTVMVSDNASSWIELGQFTGTGPLTSVTFSEQPYRYFRIRLDQDMPAPNTYWSIHDIQLIRNNGM